MKAVLKFLIVTLILSVMYASPPAKAFVQNDKAKTEVVIPDEQQAAAVTSSSSDQEGTVSPTSLSTSANAVVEEPELPPGEATWLDWIFWFVKIIGVSTLVRIVFRFIPTSGNIDWIGKIIQIINILLGAWLPNKSTSGVTHKREYSIRQ